MSGGPEAPNPEVWGIYYLASSSATEWMFAFPARVSNELEMAEALEIGSLLKKEISAFAVRLIKGITDPRLVREEPRRQGQGTVITMQEDIEMKARFVSLHLTQTLEWAKHVEAALLIWVKMPLVERMRYAPKKPGPETKDV